jgi:hypothetical protein
MYAYDLQGSNSVAMRDIIEDSGDLLTSVLQFYTK